MAEKEYIARISHGKDSLKMLEVIHSRGLHLDRITTTDIWATDTVSARLPPMEKFVAEMDQRIWDMYRIEVEHLCARNKDGSIKTYEQMFYHVPQRRSQTVQVERERAGAARYAQGTILGFPDLWNPWCQAGLKRNIGGTHQRMAPLKRNAYLVPAPQNEGADTKDSQLRYPLGAENSRSVMSRRPF